MSIDDFVRDRMQDKARESGDEKNLRVVSMRLTTPYHHVLQGLAIHFGMSKSALAAKLLELAIDDAVRAVEDRSSPSLHDDPADDAWANLYMMGQRQDETTE